MPVINDAQKASILPEMRVLEIGCGLNRRVLGSTTLDINSGLGVDIAHDLNQCPYPFETSYFDVVLAEHVLEHLDNVIPVYEEIHRILKPGGMFYVEVPHFSSSNFFTDPTHRHPYSSRSFDYFVEGAVLAKFGYSNIRFIRRSVRLSSGERSRFMKLMGKLINAHLEAYEKRFAFIFPRENLNFSLEVVK